MNSSLTKYLNIENNFQFSAPRRIHLTPKIFEFIILINKIDESNLILREQKKSSGQNLFPVKSNLFIS